MEHLFVAGMFAGTAPGFALILWANWRSWHSLRPPPIHDTSLWNILLIIAGMVATFFASYGLLVLARIPEEGNVTDFAVAFSIGNAFVFPIACYHLWLTRELWSRRWGNEERKREILEARGRTYL